MLTLNDVVHIPLTNQILLNALERMEMLSHLKRHVEIGDQLIKRFTGLVGEEAVLSYLDNATRSVNKQDVYNFDLSLAGYKIEVKSGKRKRQASLTNDCKLFQKQQRQTANIYIFTSLASSQTLFDFDMFQEVEILGWICKSEFYHIARHWGAGTIDPSNNQRMKGDSWNILVGDLHPIQTLKMLSEKGKTNDLRALSL